MTIVNIDFQELWLFWHWDEMALRDMVSDLQRRKENMG